MYYSTHSQYSAVLSVLALPTRAPFLSASFLVNRQDKTTPGPSHVWMLEIHYSTSFLQHQPQHTTLHATAHPPPPSDANLDASFLTRFPSASLASLALLASTLASLSCCFRLAPATLQCFWNAETSRPRSVRLLQHSAKYTHLLQVLQVLPSKQQPLHVQITEYVLSCILRTPSQSPSTTLAARHPAGQPSLPVPKF